MVFGAPLLVTTGAEVTTPFRISFLSLLVVIGIALACLASKVLHHVWTIRPFTLAEANGSSWIFSHQLQHFNVYTVEFTSIAWLKNTLFGGTVGTSYSLVVLWSNTLHIEPSGYKGLHPVAYHVKSKMYTEQFNSKVIFTGFI